MRRILLSRRVSFCLSSGSARLVSSTGMQCSSSISSSFDSTGRSRYYKSVHIVPLSAEDIRRCDRFRRKFLSVVNDRGFVDTLSIAPVGEGGIQATEELHTALAVALEKLCPSISAFVFDLGVPLALEQIAELLVPSIVFVEDTIHGRSSRGSVLLLDDLDVASSESPGCIFHQSHVGDEGAQKAEEAVSEWYASGDLLSVPLRVAERVRVVGNEEFDVYFDLLLKILTEQSMAYGLFISTDSDGRPYVLPGTSEYFLRRLYPCVRKDAHKSLWHVCLSAGWTGFGRSRMSDVEVLESYFDHICRLMGAECPIELVQSDLINGAGDGSILVRRKQEDHVLPSVNELARYSPLLAIPLSPSTSLSSSARKAESKEGLPTNEASTATGLKPFVLPSESPLFNLFNDVVRPQANRMKARGLPTLLAFLDSEKTLLDKFDEKSPFELIALATRLSTPSFVLEVLASCPAKRSKDPTLGPLPSWCFPLYAGYFVGGDDMKGIAEMHVRAAVKTVLSYDKSDNDVDSLRNACLELKSQLFQHHSHLSPMHANVLLCSFRFMQKHEQLHRALKKSIVAPDDAGVRSSRIKEITGNVLNSLTELEYCISDNLMHIPTKPLAPGRKPREEEPEDLKLAKAESLYQYWYLDWLASHC